MKKKYPNEDLPVYEIMIDDYDNSGIRFVSIVGEPAIEMMGMMFGKEQQLKEFDFKEVKDKQMIVGPAMIPNKKIMRKDDDGNKYMVVFSKETILQMVQKFNSTGSNRRINVDHTQEMVDAYVMENWIVEDPYYDKSRMYGFDVPVGTWMISVKIDDDKFWADEVRGQGKYGFSIEGMMSQKPVDMSIEKVIDSLTEDELIQAFNEVAIDADKDFVMKFMTKSGKVRTNEKFIDEADIAGLVGDVRWVYAYEGPDDEKTRPFCFHLLSLNKYWAQEDMDSMSAALGYDFQQYFGGFNCRHKLKRYGYMGSINPPTQSEIDSISNEQPDGLADYFSVVEKKK